MQLKAGTKLQNGKYEIERVLGQGGFGITYEAEQVALRRKVAIKEFFMKEYCERDGATSHVTLGATAGSKELVARFRTKFIREAQMIAGLEHPHIVKIYDVFEENGTAYYVMEYLEGESLSDRVKKSGAIPEEEALKYIRQVASALSYIHGRNSLHFDVKPSNILVNKAGEAILIDFGVSKHYDESGNQTSSTPVGISKGYAPMEQYQQSEISTFTPATDIYALGATLYTLLTGKVPPSASEVNEDGLPPFPAGVSKNLQNAIEKAMSPRRKDRPQTVEAFLALLDAKESSSTHSDSEETVVSSGAKPEPTPKSKPVSKPKSKPIQSSTSEKTKSKAWLWALMGGVAAVSVIVALILGGLPAKATMPDSKSAPVPPFISEITVPPEDLEQPKYVDNVYYIQVDGIEIYTPENALFEQFKMPGIGGTGFMLSDGRFVMSLSLIVPWYYFNDKIGKGKDGFEWDLSHVLACAASGYPVVINYTAYSHSGANFQFRNTDMIVPDRQETVVEVREISKVQKGHKIYKLLKDGNTVNVIAQETQNNWATMSKKEQLASVSGFDFDPVGDQKLVAGEEVAIFGFPFNYGFENSQRVNPVLQKNNIYLNGLNNRNQIEMSSKRYQKGFDGAPLLACDKNTGKWRVVGVLSHTDGADCDVATPISFLKDYE